MLFSTTGIILMAAIQQPLSSARMTVRFRPCHSVLAWLVELVSIQSSLFLNEFIFILWAGLLISVPWFFMRLGMRKTIGDPEAENLPEGFTSTVTTTSGMIGSYLSNFHVEVNSFTKANTLGLSGLMYYIDKWTVLNKETKHIRAEWRAKRKAVWAN